MLHKFADFFSGEIVLELIGGLGERLLNSCAIQGASLKNIVASATGFTVTVSYRNFKYVKQFAEKYKCKINVISKTGLCFLLAPYKHRYGVVFGIIICVVLIYISQNIIWDIRFYECTAEQEIKLRHSLYEKGICEGATITKKQIAKAEKELLIENSDFGWITLNYIKGRIIVEKTNATLKPDILDKDITNIIASHGGIVRKIDIIGGFLCVTEGQSVAKGDILVSGKRQGVDNIEIATHAEGKIFADVEKTFEASQSFNFKTSLITGNKKSYYEIFFLNTKLPFYKQIDAASECVQTLYRYPLMVLGFRFPATVYEYEVREVDESEIILNQEQATAIVRARINEAISSEFKNAKILNSSENLIVLDDKVILQTKITVSADIASKVLVKSQTP